MFSFLFHILFHFSLPFIFFNDFTAPRINMVTPSNSTSTTKRVGEQTYMQCEGEGFPAPFISWTKDGATLPGDHTNIAVQTIGGPQENQATGWLLVSFFTYLFLNPLTTEFTHSHRVITVTTRLP